MSTTGRQIVQYLAVASVAWFLGAGFMIVEGRVIAATVCAALGLLIGTASWWQIRKDPDPTQGPLRPPQGVSDSD